MNNTEKLLRAFIESQGCEIEERHVRQDEFGDDVFDYEVTKKLDEERFTFTRYMIEDLIGVLGNHTVASNGHNNDDVIATICKLENLIDENL